MAWTDLVGRAGFAAALCSLSLFALAGCGPPDGGSEDGCDSDADCKGNRTCANGVCLSTGGDGGTPDSGDDAGETMPDCDSSKDSDGDGLDNCEEARHGTDPNKADSDGDGLEDKTEVDLGTDPNKSDTDGDGLSDQTEVETQTDPNKADTDGDGLDDKTEREGTTNPVNPDTDGDGLEDGAEKKAGSNPNAKDSDGDGLEDGPEVNKYGSDPTEKDTDGDGLSDPAEVNKHGTDPAKKDTDGDGIPDKKELNGPTDATKADTDGDGLDDGAEINQHMTDATNPDSDMDGLDDGDEIKHGSDPTKSDTDGDGLSDGDEVKAGADPTKKDTDGDGLDDAFEVNRVGSNPAKKNSDGDSLDDQQEVDFGLDPTKSDTYGDGTKDGMRQWVQDCLQGNSASLNSHSNSTGNYTLTLPSKFKTYSKLTVSTSTTQNPKAAAVFSNSSGNVHGFVYSVPSSSSDAPPAQLKALAASLDGSNRTIEPGWFDAGYKTHDGHDASPGRWDVVYSSAKQPEAARDDVLFGLAPFSKSDVGGLPSASGSSETDWRAYLRLVDRGGQLVVVGAMSPQSTVNSNASVALTMAAVTDSGALAKAGANNSIECQGEVPFKNLPKAEFYWVLDQTGSMTDDSRKLKNLATPVVKALKRANVDYRFGVTNMDKANDGHLHVPPAWHTKPMTFRSEIQNRVINCTTGSSWQCSGGREYGLEAAQSGLTYMLGNGMSNPSSAEKIRSGADVYTFFMSDENANAIQEDGKSAQPFVNYFSGKTTAFSLVGDGNSCGFRDGSAYRKVSLATGGSWGSLCSSDFDRLFERMVVRAAAQSSRYDLDHAPIPSTIRVYVQGNKISRSRTDGWDYLPAAGSITFFGSARPGTGSGGSGDFVNIIYETY